MSGPNLNKNFLNDTKLCIFMVDLLIQVNRMGVPQENKSMQCCQIMTCASDK